MFRLFKVQQAEAHCDIPCGIYDPIVAKMAAQTVQKMVLRMQSLEHPAPGSDISAHQAFANTFNRYVTVKEEHAEKCKEELRILWADYAWPNTDANDIAAKFNAALKLAGQCKQTVSMENAENLVSACDDIATAFWGTKNVEYSDPNAAARYGA
jgi:nickel superoxide dismutase